MFRHNHHACDRGYPRSPVIRLPAGPRHPARTTSMPTVLTLLSRTERGSSMIQPNYVHESEGGMPSE